MCTHIMVVCEVIFCLIILNLSLYDVEHNKYIKICVRVRVLDQIFNLKINKIFVHVHVRYAFKFKLNLILKKIDIHER